MDVVFQKLLPVTVKKKESQYVSLPQYDPEMRTQLLKNIPPYRLTADASHPLPCSPLPSCNF